MEPVSETSEKRSPESPPSGADRPQAPQEGLNGRSPIILHDMLRALQAMGAGDFTVRMQANGAGIEGRIADTFNEIVSANQQLASQLEVVGQVVGQEGRTRKRVKLAMSQGAWAEMETSINTLIDDLLWPLAKVTKAIAAVAQ